MTPEQRRRRPTVGVGEDGPFCTDPACEVCGLWREAGETHGEWLARLAARWGALSVRLLGRPLRR
jgi:hypothetical protein